MIEPRSDTPTETTGRGAACAIHRFSHDAMACTFGLAIVGDDARYAQQAAQAAFDEIDRLEQILSRFIPHSDISRINDLRPGESARVSVETIECLQLAARLYSETAGAFDIAFRSARDTSPGDGDSRVPPLVLDPASRAVGVQAEGVLLDLGGLGKGYAVDRTVATLREWGIDAALVHSGQSTAFGLGHPPGGESWRVGLRRPDEEQEALGTVDLCDCALSGSGQLLHGQHIIDPRTGRPAEAAQAAWALSRSAARSDGLSTAFMVLSAEEVAGLCGRSDDASAILLPAALAQPNVLCFGTQGRLFSQETGSA